MPALPIKSGSKQSPQRQFKRHLSYPEKVIEKTTSDYFDTLFGYNVNLYNNGPKLIYRNSTSGITAKQKENDREVVAVIGSGNFGRAIATKISQSGYNVLIGSRDPEKYKYVTILTLFGAGDFFYLTTFLN